MNLASLCCILEECDSVLQKEYVKLIISGGDFNMVVSLLVLLQCFVGLHNQC